MQTKKTAKSLREMPSCLLPLCHQLRVSGKIAKCHYARRLSEDYSDRRPKTGSTNTKGTTMPRKWDLAALKEHIRINEPNKAWLLSTVDSVSHSLLIYQYHKCLARDAFASYQAEHDPDGIKMFTGAMMMGADDEFENAKLASEANLIAAINITRNAFDIFAQIVNALALPQPFCIEHCNISKVRDGLPQSPLKNEITRVTKLPWFRYLSGFSNTIKHRQLVSHQPSQRPQDATGEYQGGGAEVAAFEYRGKTFKSYWVQEVLVGTVEIHNEMLTLGISLNEWCLRSDQ
ncbi:hypothetical protein [Pseudomonas rhodesiae]|uniref:hypothetical protein n=1 Tax=Pseudomonas rhodesiae TaxID=76760 RepID=UPI001F2F85F1|nr:hypothetical protein [Pseudomonas rhodesiae]